MRYKPWILIVLGSLHILEPLIKAPLYARLFAVDMVAFLQGIISGGTLIEIYSFFLLMPVAGIAIIAIKKWSFSVFIISEILAVVVQISLIREWNRPEQLYLAYTFLVVLAVNIIVVSYFLIPAVRKVYQDERLRWWESQTRYKVNIPCSMEYILDDVKHTEEGIIQNITEGGLYLHSDHLPPQDSQIRIRFDLHFADNLDFILDGKVVHLRVKEANEGKVGGGVQYLNMPDHQSRLMKQFLKSLALMGVDPVFKKENTYSRFKNWLVQLLNTGKGLIPNIPDKYKMKS